MTSLPLHSTHGRQRRAWHDITALRQYTLSDTVGSGMTSPPLGSTHGQTTSGLAKHLRLETAHTVERRQACHAIIAFGKNPRSNDVRRGMKSPPLDSTYGRTTSGVKCHHRLWTAHSVKRHRTWLSIIAFGQHTRSNYVRRGMPSPPLDSTHCRTTSGMV